jgi:Cu-processing system permease protein
MSSTTSLIWLCARSELALATRSRWTQIFAVVFAVLALSVAWSGYVLSGGYGVQDFARTSVSLVQLVLLLVPLTSLLFGVLGLLPEGGAAELLFSQPVARRTILLGRLLGLFVALASAQAIGFGLAGLVIFTRAGEHGVLAYLTMIGISWLLTAIFLGLAALIGAGNLRQRRTRAMATALVAWFVLVILFDVVVLAVASFLSSGDASRTLIVAVLVNPVDAARTAALLAIEGTSAFGAASLALLRFTGGPGGAAAMLLGSLAAWLVIPTLLAARRLARTDI